MVNFILFLFLTVFSAVAGRVFGLGSQVPFIGTLTKIRTPFSTDWNRRVFGTMNVRVYLRFEVCGAFMGSTVRHDGPRQIRLEAASESPFTLIEIVRNGETIQKIEPGECEILWETQDGGSGGMDYYYGRLMREDGQMAWSSPVWVES